MSTVVEHCGWSRRSPQRMRYLEGLLQARGIYAIPPITNRGIRQGDRVVFTNRQVDYLEAAQFADEARLSEFVRDYHQELFAGTDLEGLRFVDSEYQVDVGSKTHSVDMLFQDHDGHDVVVEFKVGAARARDVDQLCRYLNRFVEEDLPARGVLITARPSTSIDEERIRVAITDAGHPIEWYWYSLPMPLSKASL